MAREMSTGEGGFCRGPPDGALLFAGSSSTSEKRAAVGRAGPAQIDAPIRGMPPLPARGRGKSAVDARWAEPNKTESNFPGIWQQLQAGGLPGLLPGRARAPMPTPQVLVVVHHARWNSSQVKQAPYDRGNQLEQAQTEAATS